MTAGEESANLKLNTGHPLLLSATPEPPLPKTQPTGRLLRDFLPLLPAEERLREACRIGEVAWIGSERPKEKTVDNHVRPEVLRVFCLGLDPEAPVHERGVQINGAWIESDDEGRSDRLDLEGCDLPRPLWIHSTHFTGAIVARDAKAKQLGFSGSRCAAISADRLTCTGGILLREGFLAEGTVRFLGATIGDDLACTGATFAASGGDALAFDSAEIGGGVFLNGSFRAEGTVRFLDATIGGALICTNATFATSVGDALSFERATIGGTVFLNGSFRVERYVRLSGASIGGDIVCDGGHFESIDLSRSKIGATAFFRDGFRASGGVDLRAAEIAVFVDDEDAWRDATLALDGLVLRRFGGNAPVTAAARCRWLERQYSPHLGTDFRPQPWEECARVLAEMGHERDARVLRIEKRRRMRWLEWNRVKTGRTRDAVRRALSVWSARRLANRGGALTRRIVAARIWAHAVQVTSKLAKIPAFVADIVLDLTTGYGRRPLKALGGLLLLWIAAGIGYTTLPKGVMAPADALVYLSPSLPPECRVDWIGWEPPPRAEDLSRRATEAPRSGLALDDRAGPPYPPDWTAICPHRMPSEYSTFSAFAYAADVLLPIVDLRQEHDWSPRVTDAEGRVIAPFWEGASWGWGYVARFLEWMLVLFGWGLSALLLGAVTGVIRRD